MSRPSSPVPASDSPKQQRQRQQARRERPSGNTHRKTNELSANERVPKLVTKLAADSRDRNTLPSKQQRKRAREEEALGDGCRRRGGKIKTLRSTYGRATRTRSVHVLRNLTSRIQFKFLDAGAVKAMAKCEVANGLRERKESTIPSKIVFVDGVPGSGKSTQAKLLTRTVESCAHIQWSPIVASILKEHGCLDDKILFPRFMSEIWNAGKPASVSSANKTASGCSTVVVDGFIRSRNATTFVIAMQAAFRSAKHPISVNILMLTVSRQTSVERQLCRGREKGSTRPVLESDLDPQKAAKRFAKYLKIHKESARTLRESGHEVVSVNADGNIESVSRKFRDACGFDA